MARTASSRRPSRSKSSSIMSSRSTVAGVSASSNLASKRHCPPCPTVQHDLGTFYVDLGEVSYSGSLFGSPVTGGKVWTTGFNVAALGSYPVTEEFSVFGKIGLFIWEAERATRRKGCRFRRRPMARISRLVSG
jgi:hypothetical protein